MLQFLVLDVLLKQKLVTVNSLLRKGLTDSLQLKITDKVLNRKQNYSAPGTHDFVSHNARVNLCFTSKSKASGVSWLLHSSILSGEGIL